MRNHIRCCPNDNGTTSGRSPATNPARTTPHPSPTNPAKPTTVGTANNPAIPTSTPNTERTR
ncbi:hypothetical protein AB0J49_25190, partial [Streptomyces sp. NPDC049906]